MARRPLLLAVPLLLVLGGCAPTDGGLDGTIVDQSDLEAALTTTIARIDPIPGVEDVSTTFELTGQATYQVTVSVTADTLEETGAKAVAAALSDGLGDPLFADQQVFASVEASGGTLDMSEFDLTGDELTAEVTYWYDVAELLAAPVDMQLSPLASGYQRTLTAEALGDPIDWDALAAIVDSSAAEHSWSLPGLEAYGPLPDARVAALLRDLDTVLYPLDYGFTDQNGYSIALSEGFVALSVSSLTLTGTALADSPDWPALLTASTVALSSGVDLSNISYLASDTGAGGNVHVGECAEPITPGEDDEALFAALVASGVALPAGSGAGYCAPS